MIGVYRTDFYEVDLLGQTCVIFPMTGSPETLDDLGRLRARLDMDGLGLDRAVFMRAMDINRIIASTGMVPQLHPPGGWIPGQVAQITGFRILLSPI